MDITPTKNTDDQNQQQQQQHQSNNDEQLLVKLGGIEPVVTIVNIYTDTHNVIDTIHDYFSCIEHRDIYPLTVQ